MTLSTQSGRGDDQGSVSQTYGVGGGEVRIDTPPAWASDNDGQNATAPVPQSATADIPAGSRAERHRLGVRRGLRARGVRGIISSSRQNGRSIASHQQNDLGGASNDLDQGNNGRGHG